MSPVLGSIADIAMHKNEKVFEKVWNSLSPVEQVSINNQTVTRTRKQAIEEKNYTKGVTAAEFARNTAGTEKEAGDRSYCYNMMEFYRGMKDTAAYLKTAVEYYDKYQMKVNADEIKKKDSITEAAIAIRQLSTDAKHTTGMPPNPNRATTTVRFKPVANYYSQILNNGARSVYMMTKDPVYLKKALQWSAYANKFYESPYVLDTWARLVYKVEKNVAQAIQLEEKAIALLKQRGYSTDKHNEVLDKMKNNEIIR